MKVLLTVLQNAYVDPRMEEWNSARWLSLLWKTRAGIRLKRALPEDYKLRFTNAASLLGADPGHKVEADPRHIKRTLRRVKPTVVLACGRSAEEAIRVLWDGPLLAIPHPACRVLTNDLLDMCRETLTGGYDLRAALRQGPGYYHIEGLIGA